MFCQECGKEIAEDTKFCPHCGASAKVQLAKNPASSTPVSSAPAASAPAEAMTFGEAIKTCLSKYVEFSGRATRPEYWWFYLFGFLVNIGLALVASGSILSGLISLALFLPSLAAASRRLHDTDHSAWWMLIAFTIIGVIPLIIWLASKGDETANEYGEPV